MDLGVKVMLGIAWAFGVLNLAPDLLFFLIGEGYVPTLGSLSAAASEFVYVVALAFVGPLLLWVMSRRRRAKEWEDWEQ